MKKLMVVLAAGLLLAGCAPKTVTVADSASTVQTSPSSTPSPTLSPSPTETLPPLGTTHCVKLQVIDKAVKAIDDDLFLMFTGVQYGYGTAFWGADRKDAVDQGIKIAEAVRGNDSLTAEANLLYNLLGANNVQTWHRAKGLAHTILGESSYQGC